MTSTETLNTIVNASIREMDKLRRTTGDNRLKIIASALTFEHCRQIVEAYRARGQRADYVHSREDGAANARIMQKLKNHELDVIVQVRKLGEGFDHKFLAVAAVFSIFRNLSPFVQFIGRIMRVVERDAPGHPLNHGVVVFHAGAKIARRWEDFQQYSEADQAYFDQLLPVEGLDFGTSNELEEELQPVPVTKARERQARRSGLDVRVKTEAARVLGQRKVNPEGKELDRQRLGRTNLFVLKSAIDRQIATAVARKPGERHEFDRADLDLIDAEFDAIVGRAVEEVFS